MTSLSLSLLLLPFPSVFSPTGKFPHFSGNMVISSPGKALEGRREAAEELVRGREFAQQLGRVLENSLTDGFSSYTAQDLVMKIFNSFTKSISILNCSDSDELSARFRLDFCDDSPSSWNSSIPGDFGETCVKDSMLKKDRRGCYKRKKTSFSWTIETSSLGDDGYTWRKYGQKVILKAKYHRNYFRCSRKHDEGCLATKHVQRIEEDPPKYCTTYHGHHTCRSRSLKVKSPMLNMEQQYSNLHETPNDLAGCKFSVSEYLVPPGHPAGYRRKLADESCDMTSGPGDNQCQSKYADEISKVMVESYINFDDDDAMPFSF